MLTPEMLLAFILAAPLLVFLLLSLGWLAGLQIGERTIVRITSGAFVSSTIAVVLLAFDMSRNSWSPIVVDFVDWFSAGEYRFPLQLLVDSLSLPLLGLSVIIAGLIGSFSSRYLHRDRGFFRFFLLLHLFAFGSELAFTAGSVDLLIAGWELVGLTSVLLIAFFDERTAPVRNALRAFAIYRITDVGLLLGVFFLHHAAGSSSWGVLFSGNWPAQSTPLSTGVATAVALLFLFAAAGKSAQAPFSGWLPRAMEGPTPSSALFYGAIAVHLGVYLLLRCEPLLRASSVAPTAVVIIGLITALHATLSGRAAADAKTSLAFATLAQLGVIFVEVGLGFERVALCHLIGHAAIRTLQFLRAPSMLHDYHRVHAAAGGALPKTGTHYEKMLPIGFRRWMYRFALDRSHLDTFIERFFAAPVVRSAKHIAALERGDEIRPRVSQDPLPAELITTKVAGGLDA
jgi:NADH-quinone oxidoreductase subunit L